MRASASQKTWANADGVVGLPVVAEAAALLLCRVRGFGPIVRVMDPLPPNEAVAELVDAMGRESVRTLVRTFLREFPKSMQELSAADRKNGRRLAHRMKGESRMMGAANLSRRMLEIQERLTPEGGAGLEPADHAGIAKDFEEIAAVLRAYIGD